MKHYISSSYALERVELKLLSTFNYIVKKISGFWGYSIPENFCGSRKLLMYFGFMEGEDLAPLNLALQDGLAHLKALMGDGDASFIKWTYSDHLIAEFTASLSSFQQLRYELTRFDKRVNECLDDFGICGMNRGGYYSYCFDIYRLKLGFEKDWGVEWLSDAVQSLRESDYHKTLDSEICRHLEVIIFGKDIRIE